MSPPPAPETAVPPDDRPSVCPHCDRPFRTERQRALHVGERHDCDDDERAAYETARAAESDDLFVFHLKVFFALGGIYAASIVVAIVAFSV